MKVIDIINWSLNAILLIVIIMLFYQRYRGNKIIKEISKRDAMREKALDDFIKERKERSEMLDVFIEKINKSAHQLLKDTIQLSQQKELLINRLKEFGITDFSFLDKESDKA